MPANAADSSGFRIAVMFQGGVAVLAVTLAWLVGLPLREMFPASLAELPAAVARGLAATLPLLIGLWWLTHTSWRAARRLQRQATGLVRELFGQASLAELALIAVLAGVGEELLFRGVLQTLVGGWSTELVGLVVAGLIFGLLHALSRLYFVLAALVGMYFGWLVLAYHDLTAPIITHALYDFIALAYLRRTASS